MNKCKQCGKDIEVVPGKVQRLFCSDAHRKAYKRAELGRSEATASPSVDERRTNGTGYVYLIHCVGMPYYKIGFSVLSPEKRVRVLQTNIPFDLKLIKVIHISNAVQAERYLHNYYEERRVRGEWYNFTDSELNDVLDKYEHVSLFYRIVA